MNPNLRKLVPALAMALCTCTAPAFLNPQMLTASALESGQDSAMSADDYLTYLSDGTACYRQGGELVTGKFSLEPNFMLGDVNNDNIINSNDAAALLVASAEKGAARSTRASMPSDQDRHLNLYGDVDENGIINASDSAVILQYSALKGAGNKMHPIGFSYYFADENGKLLRGRIDTATGESYYADDDYKLVTGWFSNGQSTYYMDREGVMYKQAWAEKAGQKYWLTASGEMAADTWEETDNGRCWFDADGTPAEGLRILDGKPYYFENCAMQTGWVTIGEKTCYAGEDGVLREGLLELEDGTYYLGNGYARQTGWLQMADGLHYFDENGRMCIGWAVADGLNYYFNENGVRMTGFVDTPAGRCYLDESGVRCTGWQTIDGKTYYFMTDSAVMATGWVDLDNQYYYFAADGTLCTGWQELDGNTYYFGEDGKMATGRVKVGDKTYDFGTDGVSKGEYIAPVSNTGTGKDDLLNNAVLSPRRTITVYDQQKGVGKSKVDFTFTLSDRDIEIIEQFAAENFPENSSLAEKLYITHQWIHYNNDYAYAGWKWNEIVGCSYVDAIFNHRLGQCVQYNGAMASVLAYYGYEVYMVKGYTDSGNQHFWTQVEIDGHTYMVECGNSGKNGDWWQEFFNLMY